MVTRRDIIQTTAAGSLLALAPVPSSGAGALRPPDLSFLTRERLFNAERARYFMQREGLDALVVAQPANVFYLSNHWPQHDRMGFTDTSVAIVSRDPQAPLALVMGAFLYYYSHSPESEFTDRLIFPYTQPDPAGGELSAAGEPPAQTPRMRRVNDPDLVNDLDRQRFAKLGAARHVSASQAWALDKALRELKLTDKVLGIDAVSIQALLDERGVSAEVRPAENTIRRIRLAKSPAELKLMRFAAQQNVDAAVATAQAVRDIATTRELRARFYSEAAMRGNLGVYMVIDGTSSELVDKPIAEGMAFSIDCVSSCRFYHGDFARTIFVGEPHPKMRQVCDAIAVAWRELQTQLRPGLRFADVTRLGRESIKKQGLDLNVAFTPHAVGLFHTDHPRPSLHEPRTVDGLVLEENMILSVDCPVLEAGIGGSAHLEDLMLIKPGGAEPIHDVPPGVFVV